MRQPSLQSTCTVLAFALLGACAPQPEDDTASTVVESQQMAQSAPQPPHAPQSARADSGPVPIHDADRAASTITHVRDSNGLTIPHLLNSRWLTAELRYGQGFQLVLLERDSLWWCNGEIGWCHVLTLHGWLHTVPSESGPRWSVTIRGGEPVGFHPWLFPAFYQVHHRGCCDVAGADEFFDVWSGNSAFRSTVPLMQIDVPNTRLKRYVGFLDTWSALTPHEVVQNTAIGGVLQYGPARGPVQRVAVVHARSGFSHCCRIGNMELRGEPTSPGRQQISTWQTDELRGAAAITDFWIALELLPDYDMDWITVLVPVESDRLDLSRAVVPEGLTLLQMQGAT